MHSVTEWLRKALGRLEKASASEWVRDDGEGRAMCTEMQKPVLINLVAFHSLWVI